MRFWIVSAISVIICIGTFASEGLARRTYFTAEQRAQLQAIQTIWVKVLALTERGKGDGQAIQESVRERLTTLGYEIVTSRVVGLPDSSIRLKMAIDYDDCPRIHRHLADGISHF